MTDRTSFVFMTLKEKQQEYSSDKTKFPLYSGETSNAEVDFHAKFSNSFTSELQKPEDRWFLFLMDQHYHIR